MLAARCLPWIVGWSGTAASHSSSLNLNWSTVPVLVSLRSLGMRLNSLAPLTDRLASLAFLTEDGPGSGEEAQLPDVPSLGSARC